jgi:stage V sporulation protein SpoVS
MNASSRNARRIVKARRAATKDHRKGLHTLKSHALRAGLDDSVAGGVAGALRSKGKACGITGRAAIIARRTDKGVKMVKGARRFTQDEFLALATAYNPRAAKYVAAREQLLSV